MCSAVSPYSEIDFSTVFATGCISNVTNPAIKDPLSFSETCTAILVIVVLHTLIQCDVHYLLRVMACTLPNKGHNRLHCRSPIRIDLKLSTN